jgi:hypothetical protein
VQLLRSEAQGPEGGPLMAVELVQGVRGEERIETGQGWVIAFEGDTGKRNLMLQIRAEHLQQHPLVAWIDSHTQVELHQRVLEAHASGVKVGYRIAVRRKSSAPLDKPVAALANTQKVRELDDLVLVGAAVSVGAGGPSAAPPPPPAAAPAAGGPPRATTPACLTCGGSLEGSPVAKVAGGYVHGGGGCPGPDTATPERHQCPDCDAFAFDTAEELDEHRAEECRARKPATPPQAAATARNGDVAPSGADPAAEGRERQERQAAELAARREARQKATTFDAGAAEDHPVPSIPPAQARGPRVAEGRPWEPYNGDGSLNLGSYAMQAILGFLEYAHKLAAERVRQVRAETGDEGGVTMPQVVALARTLLRIADNVQAANRQDGRTDRMDNSHTRARGAVRTALEVYPVPWGVDADARQAWEAAVTEHAGQLVRVSFGMLREYMGGDS